MYCRALFKEYNNEINSKKNIFLNRKINFVNLSINTLIILYQVV